MTEGQRKARGMQRQLSIYTLIALAMIFWLGPGPNAAGFSLVFSMIGANVVIDAMRHLAKDRA